MSRGRIIQPVAFVRRSNLRPQHFAFASATRAPHSRKRTLSPVVYLTHELGVTTIKRRVVIGGPAVPLVPPVPPPSAARLFGVSVYRRGWVAWEKETSGDARAAAHGAASSAVLQELLADYAIIDAVASKNPSELVVAIFHTLDINSRPQIATMIRDTILSSAPALSDKDLTKELDRHGVVVPADSNRRPTCERLLLAFLARAFAGTTSSASTPEPTGIDKIVMDEDLKHGSLAEAILRAVLSA